MTRLPTDLPIWEPSAIIAIIADPDPNPPPKSPAQLAFSLCHPPLLVDSPSHLLALAFFIAKQKALLARTQSDLTALCRLRSDAVADVDAAGAGLAVQLGALRAQRPDPLRTLAFALPRTAPARPPRPQTSKNSYARILDSVLAVYGKLDDPPAAPEHTKALHATTNWNGNRDECAGPRGCSPAGRTSGSMSMPPAETGGTTAIDPSTTASPCRSASAMEAEREREVHGERDREGRERAIGRDPMALAKPVRAAHLDDAAAPERGPRGAAFYEGKAEGRQAGAVPVAAPAVTPEVAKAAAPAPKQQRLKLILPARSAAVAAAHATVNARTRARSRPRPALAAALARAPPPPPPPLSPRGQRKHRRRRPLSHRRPRPRLLQRRPQRRRPAPRARQAAARGAEAGHLQSDVERAC
ncbi:hypothetical protein B0H17DRAFT_1193782 [Mycena rosella]|uniref:Uncharacterized protein n=1 Tax=Mycena rosella TaxID=1033263 RepID=A0AAD7GT43_MYCRO|nr:hypothetical protein B0H17DRAFT_1193782 [Mycena rosella]